MDFQYNILRLFRIYSLHIVANILTKLKSSLSITLITHYKRRVIIYYVKVAGTQDIYSFIPLQFGQLP